MLGRSEDAIAKLEVDYKDHCGPSVELIGPTSPMRHWSALLGDLSSMLVLVLVHAYVEQSRPGTSHLSVRKLDGATQRLRLQVHRNVSQWLLRSLTVAIEEMQGIG